METKLIIQELITIVIMVMVIIFTKDFFNYYRCEARGLKWNKIKKLPKQKKDEKTIRLMVSLENGVVMFDEYDYEKKSFSVDGVIAWRNVPPSYNQYKGIFKNILRSRKNEA